LAWQLRARTARGQDLHLLPLVMELLLDVSLDLTEMLRQ